jgi:flagellar assembly factor FliW
MNKEIGVEPMKYATAHFGEVEVEPNRIIKFPRGLPGFNELKEFFLLPVPENDYFAWLQSASIAEVAFLLTNPFLFYPDYKVRLPLAERQLLQVKKAEEITVHVIVRLPSTGQEGQITANFLAPVVINSGTQRGCQLLLEDSGYLVREPLFKVSAGVDREKGGR